MLQHPIQNQIAKCIQKVDLILHFLFAYLPGQGHRFACDTFGLPGKSYPILQQAFYPNTPLLFPYLFLPGSLPLPSWYHCLSIFNLDHSSNDCHGRHFPSWQSLSIVQKKRFIRKREITCALPKSKANGSY